MWVIFRDPKTPFNHLDKFVVELVEEHELPQPLQGLGGVRPRGHGAEEFRVTQEELALAVRPLVRGLAGVGTPVQF